ncbi:MAG: glycosyltransferase family 4 protein [Nigerium sp.]|nr:glycosyltransferase family 4 protein [Nigerium sp.]
MSSVDSPIRRPARLVVGVTVGVSAYSLLRGQLAWFAQAGWDVALIANPDEAAQRAAQREGVRLVGVPMERKIAPTRDIAALAQWIRILRATRPDAINVGTPKAALLGMVAAWLSRVPRRLYTVRGLRLEGASGFASGVLWLAEWLTMRLSTDVLFVSRSLAHEARRRRLTLGRKSWVTGGGSSNGVDSSAVALRVAQLDRGEERLALGLEPSHVVVGFVGRISSAKGIDVLLRACGHADLNPRVRLLMVGTVEDEGLRVELERRGSRVTHVPWTDDVWRYLGVIDILCLPTLREGFPNVVLEAAAAGVPSITTNATGAIDSVVPGETGFIIDIGDSNALVLRINQLAEDPRLTSRMGLAARQRVVAEYAPERIWMGIAELLEGVVQPVYAQRIEPRGRKG